MYASSYKIHYNNLCQCISQFPTGYRKFFLQLFYHITVKQYGAIQLFEVLLVYTLFFPLLVPYPLPALPSIYTTFKVLTGYLSLMKSSK